MRPSAQSLPIEEENDRMGSGLRLPKLGSVNNSTIAGSRVDSAFKGEGLFDSMHSGEGCEDNIFDFNKGELKLDSAMISGMTNSKHDAD